MQVAFAQHGIKIAFSYKARMTVVLCLTVFAILRSCFVVLPLQSDLGSFHGMRFIEALRKEQNATLPSNDDDDAERLGRSSNRTMVVLLGNLRCGELAWESLYRNVLDVNSADLALVTQEPREDLRTASLFRRAKYVWKVPYFDDWADALDQINGSAWREALFQVYHPNSIVLGGIGGRRGSGAIIFWLRWFLSERIRDLGWTEKYDRFIVTRNDHYYLCPHDLGSLDPSYLWLPTGQNYGGLSDRHLVVSSKDLLQALDILPPVLANPHNYKQLIGRRVANSERLLSLRWKEEGLFPLVRRFPRTMFICAMDGDISTLSAIAPNETNEGVHLKYEEEYIDSVRNCNESKFAI
jgi:hypothetical protein